MVHRYEAQSKAANFGRIIQFPALLRVLNILPVRVLKCCVVVHVQTRAVEIAEGLGPHGGSRVPCLVVEHHDSARFGVVCILNEFLDNKKMPGKGKVRFVLLE